MILKRDFDSKFTMIIWGRNERCVKLTKLTEITVVWTCGFTYKRLTVEQSNLQQLRASYVDTVWYKTILENWRMVGNTDQERGGGQHL